MKEISMSTGKPRRYIVRGAKVAAGTMLAAATLAASTAFSGVGTSTPSPAAASSRIDGVHADLAHAVALRQVTQEQAGRFEQQLIRRIQSDA
ncbi:hypothetical protein [Arthrobacter sp. A5]|uniref:hypothetical protein n=1 Tax=Arthrobacter sp. A5 TaxID=576926 RepID=UPI003DA8B21C